MKIYWYWPHPHRATSEVILAALKPEDSVTVHALSAYGGEALGDSSDYEVVRTLPDPVGERRGPVSRALHPIRLAAKRSQARSALLRRGFDVAYLGMLFHHSDWLEIDRLRRRQPLVSHVHDVLPHFYRLPQRIEHGMLTRLYQSAGHLVVYHEVLKDQLVSHFEIDPALVHVVPHPVGPSPRINPPESGERPLLLYFGRFRSNKGVEVLMDALALVGPDLRADVVIAGGGDEGLERRAHAELGRFPNVHLELGHVTDERKHKLLCRAAWLVLPYTSFSSQSGVLADAYRYRVPLIVTDVGAIGATVRADQSGIVLPPNNPHALAEALITASETDIADHVAALERAAERHSEPTVGRALRSIFERVIADR